MASDTHSDADLGAQALAAAVHNTGVEHADATNGIHDHGDPAATHGPKRHAWLEHLVPGIERLTVKYHVGNYVALRDPSKPPGSVTIFESMPIYARRVFFVFGPDVMDMGKRLICRLGSACISCSTQGEIYDSPKSVHSIPSFIQTYKIDTLELLESDISKYNTFNEFFYRKLKLGARPVQNTDPRAICSAADCRLTVYHTINEAQKFWRGDEFSLSVLLHGPSTSHTHHQLSPPEPNPPPYSIDTADASLAIFRLAPADYHRFHSPINGTLLHGPVDIPGTYYTVNPQAVNEVDFDVFTANKRSVMYIREAVTGKTVAFVAVGALLVGAIGWSKKEGDQVQLGEELGWFAYGGSTVIVAFPAGMVQFDEDLRVNSDKALETFVKVGDSLGVLP
ncbi:hypothetical protein EW145_g1929 [Phellinidium pouzarii]|uniref:Phosphatidylserine decarboxylase n=1 Tax=Phellinidium pouzarii TaxID=167371 RepID=A0A4V3XDF7_9AGAM|nr:hypothetical protein EW145_g1929 [Phellinidium pouzarii]